MSYIFILKKNWNEIVEQVHKKSWVIPECLQNTSLLDFHWNKWKGNTIHRPCKLLLPSKLIKEKQSDCKYYILQINFLIWTYLHVIAKIFNAA